MNKNVMKRIFLMLGAILLLMGCKKDHVFMRGEIGSINGYEYVDLGLPSGIKWATCNVGAISPYDVGDYYAWGETETKPEYWLNNSTDTVIMDISGNPEYDVARKKWGTSWRMPTAKELEELVDLCIWKWNSYSLHQSYYEIIGPNGLSITLPCSGYIRRTEIKYSYEAYYWSSTPSDKYSYEAYALSDDYVRIKDKDYGMPIRPVSE